jgi:hypothetical protein
MAPITVAAKCFRLLEHWDRGFESHSRHRRMSACSFVFLFSCGGSGGSGRATVWSPIQGVVASVCMIHGFRLILNGNMPEGLIHQRKRKWSDGKRKEDDDNNNKIYIKRGRKRQICYVENIYFVSHPSEPTLVFVIIIGARGSVVGWGSMLQAGMLRVRLPMGSLDFIQLT